MCHQLELFVIVEKLNPSNKTNAGRNIFKKGSDTVTVGVVLLLEWPFCTWLGGGIVAYTPGWF